MLPVQLSYPFDERFGATEIVYWRKNWSLRNEVVNTFPKNELTGDYLIETANDVFKLIKIIVSFMDRERWEEEGESIWEYDEILPILQRDVMNLAIIAAFMQINPDIYLEFYDSY